MNDYELIKSIFDNFIVDGKKIPAELRETALGGCATAPSACGACNMCS